MELLRIYLLIAIWVTTEQGVDCHKTQKELDHIYLYGNSSSKFVFRDFSKRNVRFFMYNRIWPKGYRMYENYKNFRRSGFDSSHPTKVLIHGYLGSYASSSVQMLRHSYMASGNYNVIAVDWSAYNYPYPISVSFAPLVGSAVGDMILFISRNSNMKLADVHVVGHSLGAHVAGYSGKSVINRMRKGKGQTGVRAGSYQFGRITGLDPAAPVFSQFHPSRRLSSGDAQFVDIIHTSTRFLGMTRNIGDADFYPNGGSWQPICQYNVIEAATGLCDHVQAYVYFSQSIRNRRLYPATSCNSAQEALSRRCSGRMTSFMGEDAIRGPKGIYYVGRNQLRKHWRGR